MNKLKASLVLFTLAIMLGGCPYESKVPIDKPAIKINTALLGYWDDAREKERYTVNQIDDFTYKIDQRKDSGEVKIYNAYLSSVGKDLFLNIYNPAETAPKFMFYKIAIAEGAKAVTLSSVTENIDEMFERPEDLKAFFEKNKSLSFFYEKEDIILSKLP